MENIVISIKELPTSWKETQFPFSHELTRQQALISVPEVNVCSRVRRELGHKHKDKHKQRHK